MKKVLISLVAMVLVLTGLVSATTTTLVPSDITMDVTDAKTTEFCIYSDAGMTLPLNVAVSVGTVCRDIDGLVGCSGADIASPAGFSVTPVDATTGADGVGLCRLEFMIADNGVHPAWYIREGKEGEYTAMLVENLSKIAGAFEGKPVWVRTSDIRTDEYRNLKGADREPKESDPMIGWHAIRRGLDEPKILKAEFQAVKELHKRGFTNVGVMIPFVIRASEVAAAKEIMREVGMEPLEDVEFGVMVETPAACWIIDELCREGISNNEKIAKLFDEMHPAVLGEIEMVLSVAKKYGVQTSICGQAGSKPEMARFLVKRGCTSISANPDAVAKIRETVAKVEKELGVK